MNTLTKNSEHRKESIELTDHDDNSQSAVQLKIIQELQKSVKLLQETQSHLMTHARSLEDAVITSPNTEDNTVEHRKAKKVAANIKRKQQDTENNNGNDSDASDELQGRRTSLRFKNKTKIKL